MVYWCEILTMIARQNGRPCWSRTSRQRGEDVAIAHGGGIEEDVARPQRAGEHEPFERAAARERNIGLAVREGSKTNLNE